MLRLDLYDKFQFTLPRGERRSWLARSSHRQGFNSRSREGSDELMSLSI